MNRLQDQSRAFEVLVGRIFVHAGYIVQPQATVHREDRVFRLDLVAERRDETLAIEIKWSRLDPIPLGTLRDWAARVRSYVGLVKGADMVLAVSGQVDPSHADWILREYQIEVFDRRRIEALASGDAQLEADLRAFAARTTAMEMERIAAQTAETDPTDLPAATESLEAKLLGEELIQRLAATPRGQPGAKAYEALCIDIIDYVFGEHLVDAQPQSRSEDGLSVMDVVYRVRTTNGFWKTLTRDFRARVILFEFKNYTDSVSPQQVYTTERYMSVSAMRPICFLITRSKPHEHAELAAFGAMREGGKLLVFLSDEDLATMLRFRDAEVRALAEGRTVQNEPSILLDQKIYTFLSTMAR